jgi:hypothetical protein
VQGPLAERGTTLGEAIRGNERRAGVVIALGGWRYQPPEVAGCQRDMSLGGTNVTVALRRAFSSSEQVAAEPLQAPVHLSFHAV